MMKFIYLLTMVILSLATAAPAAAALAVGDPAPGFSAPGAQAGAIKNVELSELLKNGPVVIYFFPSAFANAAQSREFAEKIDKFSAAGASVVGISRDSLDALVRYSMEACDGKFPVVSADEALVNAYDVNDGAMFNTRTTYVIDSSGDIAFVHDSSETQGHVNKALEFVQVLAFAKAMSSANE